MMSLRELSMAYWAAWLGNANRHLDTAPQEGWLKESRRLLEDFREAVRMTAAPQKTQI